MISQERTHWCCTSGSRFPKPERHGPKALGPLAEVAGFQMREAHARAGRSFQVRGGIVPRRQRVEPRRVNRSLTKSETTCPKAWSARLRAQWGKHHELPHGFLGAVRGNCCQRSRGHDRHCKSVSGRVVFQAFWLGLARADFFECARLVFFSLYLRFNLTSLE